MKKIGTSNVIARYVGSTLVWSGEPPPAGATLTLSGIDIGSAETGFRDEKSIVSLSGPWTTLGTRSGALAGIGLSYSVDYEGQPYNTRMWIRTVATNGSGDGPSYPALEIVTRPSELPSDFGATPDGAYAILLEWTPPSVLPIAGGYILSMDDGTGFEELVRIPTGTNSYLHPLRAAATEYSYRITCYNTNSTSITAVMPTYLSVTATTEESPYVIEADFDNGNTEHGIENYWTASGTYIFDYPVSNLWGGKCMFVISGAIYRELAAPLDEMHFFCAVKIGVHNIHFRFGGLSVLLTASNDIWFGNSSSFYVVGTDDFPVNVPQQDHPDTPIYIWISYVRGTGGGNGTASILWSLTPEKPTAVEGVNSSTVSHASLNEACNSVQIQDGMYDHVRVSASPIGSYPN